MWCPKPFRDPAETRSRLIAAAQGLMLKQGFAATTVDQICAGAGLTKGAFFHHFPDKGALCRAAVEAWGEMGARIYGTAWSDPALEPIEQLDRMLDLMISFTRRPEPCVCMVGMMSQELALQDEAMRALCARLLEDWTGMVARLLAEARRRTPPVREFDPEQVAWLLNSIWQGSMLIAKNRQSPELIVANLELARSFVAGLFPPSAVPAPRAEGMRDPPMAAPPEGAGAGADVLAPPVGAVPASASAPEAAPPVSASPCSPIRGGSPAPPSPEPRTP